MIPRPSGDEQNRDRIRTSLDESLIVEASAGTGKTTELVRRIVAVLANGADIRKIVAVTFTHKAAGELKLRLREELDKQRGEYHQLEDALKNFEEASIGTIHSFCAQILRERPVEANVDPSFEELNEQEGARLYQRAFRAWLERQLNEESPGLRRAFARLAYRDSWDDSPPIEQLQWAGRKLIEWRDYTAPWHREPFAREEEIQTILRLVRELAEASRAPRRVTDNLYKSLAPARALADSTSPLDADALESSILKLGRDLRRDTRKGSGVYSDRMPRETLLAKRDDVMRWIEEFRRRADADLAVALREEMRSLVDEYEDRKQRTGKLDFVDLLIKVRDLIRDQPRVRGYLQNRFTHLFVDEFQDTDPLQAEILLLLAADDPAESNWLEVTPQRGKLFLVGDPKQSIYKFRRADIVLYREIRQRLCDRGVGFVTLTKSFRSVRNIQQFVNAAFEMEMTGDDQADWAPLEQHREDRDTRPSVIALPVPRPYRSRIAKDAINKSLPDAIAAFIHWMVETSEWGFRARDIAVLFRRRTQGGNDLTRDYARALEARSIPHLLAGSRSFHRREEIETLRAALTAIEWPDDELSVFATLKGSLFAIPDEALLQYRHQHGRLHPFRKTEFPAVSEALDLLAHLHRERNRQPFAATINGLLEATRAHAGFVMRPGGNQILANVSRLADLARAYEISGGISFRGFVEELAAQAEKEEASEAPVLEEDSDGVRLLTVHGAKGLEFPVVILADMTANLSAREPDQFVDGTRRLSATRLLRCAPRELADHEPEEASRERAEGIRVAYVAATRARDLLVVPAIGDEAFEGWLSPLNKAVYPSRDNWRRSIPAKNCPPFGGVTVLDRPMEYDREEEFSVRPGLIEPQTGTHEVVWWDPSKLQLNVEAGFGIRQKEILEEDGGASLAAYRDWEAARAKLLVDGAIPQYDVFIATQATDDPPQRIEVIAEKIAHDARPRGKRFGSLVHAALRDVELAADAALIAKIVELNARSLGAPKDEIDAAKIAVAAALAHPILGRARNAERCHREYPITLKLGNRIIDGIIDLVFLENNRWTIVDFKTDDRPEVYERQLRWYAYALEQLTRVPAGAILFNV
jgi:ATP-dependent exoDNAse (exonuclease V) beta subunit